MNRILVCLLGAMLMCGSVYAETAVQQDQNAGFLDFATTTFTLNVASSVFILGEAPGNVASWTAANPNSTFCVLPRNCKGFVMNATGAACIVGHPNDVASTTSAPVGFIVANGSSFQWASRNPNQTRVNFKVIHYGGGTVFTTLTFSGWGE